MATWTECAAAREPASARSHVIPGGAVGVHSPELTLLRAHNGQELHGLGCLLPLECRQCGSGSRGGGFRFFLFGFGRLGRGGGFGHLRCGTLVPAKLNGTGGHSCGHERGPGQKKRYDSSFTGATRPDTRATTPTGIAARNGCSLHCLQPLSVVFGHSPGPDSYPFLGLSTHRTSTSHNRAKSPASSLIGPGPEGKLSGRRSSLLSLMAY